MGNILGGGNNNGGNNGGLGSFGSFGFEEQQCCNPVVDPISLLTTIGAIAAVSAFLRQAVIDNMVAPPRRKRRSLGQEMQLIFDLGNSVLD